MTKPNDAGPRQRPAAFPPALSIHNTNKGSAIVRIGGLPDDEADGSPPSQASPSAEPNRPTTLVVPRDRDDPLLSARSTCDVLVEDLVHIGVKTAFGLVGGAIAPFCEALARSSIRVLHTRHESGAAFAALEESLASGRPTVVFVTTGPGVTNALTGMIAARWEGAKVILVSGTTSPAQRGRWAFQETSAYTIASSGLYAAGSIFDYAVAVEDPVELDEVASRLAAGVSRRSGFVAHIGLPIGLQTAPSRPRPRARISSMPPACDEEALEQSTALLSSGPFAIWVGFGARHASGPVRTLAERSGACVMCSPRGKGIFPEDHPLFVGVTGLAGHPSVFEALRMVAPRRTLVLGSRLGEFTSFWSPEFVPPEGFVHVDVDPQVFGAAYPQAPTLGIQADIGRFVSSLLERWPESLARSTGALAGPPAKAMAATQGRAGCVRPSALMAAIQRVVIDGHDALVLTEAGNSFLLGTHHLRFRVPGRFRVSTGFGSMGHAVAGVLGAAHGSERKAVALVGDGAMLMQSEISTAVHYGIDAAWIVLNDARYGMIENGMRAQGFSPVETELPAADFVSIALGMGAEGVRVTNEWELDAALESAMASLGPFVVDVVVDRTEPAPPLWRAQSLCDQGASGFGRQS
jgi:acetolactate synthase-1/2/3 large subunit